MNPSPSSGVRTAGFDPARQEAGPHNASGGLSNRGGAGDYVGFVPQFLADLSYLSESLEKLVDVFDQLAAPGSDRVCPIALKHSEWAQIAEALKQHEHIRHLAASGDLDGIASIFGL